MLRLVIDTDPGVDDAHAIMMALAHPNVQVEAITTVAGNVSVDKTTANALKILDVMNAGIPVYPGSAHPLIAKDRHAEYVHGQDGLGDAGILPSQRSAETEHAASALVRLANQNPGELTLVAIGPLTNLALATRLDPDLPHKYKRLVVMGGAIRSQGNTTPTAEFNIYTDPEAAAIVFDAWRGLTLVSWETTLEHCFTAEQVDALLAVNSPRAEFFRKISGNTLAFIEQFLGRRMLFAADFLAMAAAVEPEMVLSAQDCFAQVELCGQYTRGQTAVDWSRLLNEEPNVCLVLKLDGERLFELFKMALQSA